jgi:hypothetical protein
MIANRWGIWQSCERPSIGGPPRFRRALGPHSVVCYLPPAGDGSETKFYDIRETNEVRIRPVMLFGLDVTDFMRANHERLLQLLKDS